MKGLIGYTGFVGSNLMKQHAFDICYNSGNIHEIDGRSFDMLVCAGIPGTKWLANKYPKEDIRQIRMLLKHLSTISCERFVLISTIDVYEKPQNVDELTILTKGNLQAYGMHRILAEEFVEKQFSTYHIIRLPGIYGENLRKNFIFDLLNSHCLHWTHEDSEFQYYNLKYIWRDIQTVIDKEIKLINFNAEPISAKELAKKCFDFSFENKAGNALVKYDVKSIYAEEFGSYNQYMQDKSKVIEDIKDFADWYYDRGGNSD